MSYHPPYAQSCLDTVEIKQEVRQPPSHSGFLLFPGTSGSVPARALLLLSAELLDRVHCPLSYCSPTSPPDFPRPFSGPQRDCTEHLSSEVRFPSGSTWSVQGQGPILIWSHERLEQWFPNCRQLTSVSSCSLALDCS